MDLYDSLFVAMYFFIIIIIIIITTIILLQHTKSIKKIWYFWLELTDIYTVIMQSVADVCISPWIWNYNYKDEMWLLI